jgi:TP901 family phage tail tape measure protein
VFDAGSIVFNIQVAGDQVFQTAMAGAEQTAKKVGTTSKETAKSTEELGKKQETAAQSAKRLAKEQAEAARAAKQLGEDVKRAQTQIGTAAVGIGASVLAMVALTAKVAIDWESAWAGVTKTVEGTPEELGAVEDGLRDLTKVLPASHQEIAAVAEAAGQLGVQTKNVVAFTRTMIDLGETTNLSANEAATALARFMNVMGTSQDKVSNLGSSVVELGNNYATTEAEIVAMATRLSGASKQVGLTEGETLGLAAALSSVGIEAEAGGSAVSKVMIDIAASVDKGGKRLDQFAEIAGVSADEFAKKWKTDPGAALALFVKGLADAESQGGSTLGMLEELGITEVRMRDALLRSAAASDSFTEAMGTGNEAFEANNALTTEAAKRYDTVASKLEITKNNVMDAAIGFGQVFLPAISEASEGLSVFASFLGGLPEPVQGAIGVLALFAGAIILSGGVALLAIPKIAEFRVATALLAAQMPKTTAALRGTASFLAGPWGLALAAAAVGVALLVKYIEDAEASTEEMTASVEGSGTAIDVMATHLRGLATSAEGVSEATQQIKNLDLALRKTNEAGYQSNQPGISRTYDTILTSVKKVGETLGTLAENDLPAAQKSFRDLADETDGSDERLLQLLDTMPAYKDALIVQATKTGDYSAAMSEAEKQTVLLDLAQGDAADGTKSSTEAYVEAADEVEGLQNNLDALIDTINAANGVGQDAVSQNIDYQDSLREVDAQIAAIAAGTDGYSLGISANTAAGAENLGMLNDLAQSSQDAAKAQFDLDNDTAAYKVTLEAGRQALIDKALALGATADEAENLADKIYAIPSEKEFNMIVDSGEATTRLRKIQDLIDGIGNTSTLHIATGGSGGITKADGGKVNFYANGGRENHIAQFARAGTMRVWAEPETGGEWYIPASPAKRGRSTQVLAEAADEFGYALTPKDGQSFAGGGRTAPTDAQIMGGRKAPTRIEGTLDLGGGLTGIIRGVINNELGGL